MLKPITDLEQYLDDYWQLWVAPDGVSAVMFRFNDENRSTCLGSIYSSDMEATKQQFLDFLLTDAGLIATTFTNPDTKAEETFAMGNPLPPMDGFPARQGFNLWLTDFSS